ncbi:DNA polymerase IV [bacterium HR40]|nr:DNA polymerase IV [bacterium HR40]
MNAPARRFGLRPGMTVADARAILPQLQLQPHDVEADARALLALGHWCRRYTPSPALDPPDGLLLDVTGCAHLFGGEQALCVDLAHRLEALGFRPRIGIADGPLAARAWTRFGAGGVLSAEHRDAALRALPLAALDLDPALLADLLRLGFRRIGELAELPRSALRRRFGPLLGARLDALLGDGEEPFRPLLEPPDFSLRRDFPEPVERRADIEIALADMLAELETGLVRAGRGARKLVLRLFDPLGEMREITLALGTPLRRAQDLHGLFRLRLERSAVGQGVETLVLDAIETVPLPARQAGLLRREMAEELARLLESLRQRLGADRVLRLHPVASHVPERAMRLVDATLPVSDADWPVIARRPLALLAPSPRIAALAPVPDGPPVAILRSGRRERIVQAGEPERILPEWWREEDRGARVRDFHLVVTEAGARLWVCREGAFGDREPPVWRLVGLFD